jgi:hypothetical protein
LNNDQNGVGRFAKLLGDSKLGLYHFDLLPISFGPTFCYQRCWALHVWYACENSAPLSSYTESYGIFIKTLTAVQTARQNFGDGIFQAR